MEQENIKSMVKGALEKDPLSFKKFFQSVMRDKVRDALAKRMGDKSIPNTPADEPHKWYSIAAWGDGSPRFVDLDDIMGPEDYVKDFDDDSGYRIGIPKTNIRAIEYMNANADPILY